VRAIQLGNQGCLKNPRYGHKHIKGTLAHRQRPKLPLISTATAEADQHGADEATASDSIQDFIANASQLTTTNAGQLPTTGQPSGAVTNIAWRCKSKSLPVLRAFFCFLFVFISTCLVTVTPQCILFSEMVKKDSYIKNLKSVTPL
jgi:hypothetical protein